MFAVPDMQQVPLYRHRFFDPLIADVAVSLAGRDAYLELDSRTC